VDLTNGLVEEGLTVDPGVKEGGEGGGSGEVVGGREFSGLDTAEAVRASGSSFRVVVEKVKDPGGGFGDVAVKALFNEREVVEGVR